MNHSINEIIFVVLFLLYSLQSHFKYDEEAIWLQQSIEVYLKSTCMSGVTEVKHRLTTEVLVKMCQCVLHFRTILDIL